MKMKLPPGKTNGNIKIYVPNRDDKKRLQEILNDKEGNAVRNSIINYYANRTVNDWLNINYLNSDTSIPDEIQI